MRDREARFDRLYTTHYRAIYSYVYRRLASQTGEVADTVAEVFAVAWRRLDEAPEGESERLWLYGVAHRCVLRTRRTDWRRLRLLARLTDEARIHTSSSGPSSREEEMRGAIERLPARDREVLRLVVWDELSHAEAAVVLGCSTNAVSQRLHSARTRLRRRTHRAGRRFVGNHHHKLRPWISTRSFTTPIRLASSPSPSPSRVTTYGHPGTWVRCWPPSAWSRSAP